MLNALQLKQITPSTPRATLEAHLPYLNAALLEFNLTTRLRQAAFLAQIMHESGGLKLLEETLNYSSARIRAIFPKYPAAWKHARTLFKPADQQAIANIVYGGRLGNTQAGDGWRYRGRGVIQLTGRGNYKRYGGLLGVDLERDPDLAAQPKLAWRIAGLYWTLKGINRAADRADLREVTRMVNGGYNNLDDRLRLYHAALNAIPERLELPKVFLEGKQLEQPMTFREGLQINGSSLAVLHLRFNPVQFDSSDHRTIKHSASQSSTPRASSGREVIADGVNITGRRMVGAGWIVNAADPMNVYIRRRVKK